MRTIDLHQIPILLSSYVTSNKINVCAIFECRVTPIMSKNIIRDSSRMLYFEIFVYELLLARLSNNCRNMKRDSNTHRLRQYNISTDLKMSRINLVLEKQFSSILLKNNLLV